MVVKWHFNGSGIFIKKKKMKIYLGLLKTITKKANSLEVRFISTSAGDQAHAFQVLLQHSKTLCFYSVSLREERTHALDLREPHCHSSHSLSLQGKLP